MFSLRSVKSLLHWHCIFYRCQNIICLISESSEGALQSGFPFHGFSWNLWLFDDKEVDVLFQALSKSDMKYPIHHTTAKNMSIQKNFKTKPNRFGDVDGWGHGGRGTGSHVEDGSGCQKQTSLNRSLGNRHVKPPILWTGRQTDTQLKILHSHQLCMRALNITIFNPTYKLQA